jgi:pimeloyl-ACP methyl ester carboxylesterase
MSRTPIDHLPDATGLVRVIDIPVGPDGEKIAAIFHGALIPDSKHIHEAPDDREDRPATLVIMAHHAPGGHKSAENDIFGDLEHHLAHAGFDTIRFDFRGCGTSDGLPENTTLSTMRDDMAALHKWALAEGYAQLVHIGDGIGALAVLLNMHEKVKAMVMLWPVLRPAACYFAEAFAKLDEAEARGDTVIELMGERVGIRLLRELQTLNIVKNLQELRIPVLVQHGENDQHIPTSQLDILKKHATRARRIEITTYEGGTRGLRQLQERRTLFYHTRQFLNRYC